MSLNTADKFNLAADPANNERVRAICAEYVAAVTLESPMDAPRVMSDATGIYSHSKYPSRLLFKPAKLNSGSDFHFPCLQLVFETEEEADDRVPVAVSVFKINQHRCENVDTNAIQHEVSARAYDEKSMRRSNRTPEPFDIYDMNDRYFFHLGKREIIDMYKRRAVTPDQIFRATLQLHHAPCFRWRGLIYRVKAALIKGHRRFLEDSQKALKWILKNCLGRELIVDDAPSPLTRSDDWRIPEISGYRREDIKVTDAKLFKFGGHEVQLAVGVTYISIVMVAWVVIWLMGSESFFDTFPSNSAAFTVFSVFCLVLLEKVFPPTLLWLLNYSIARAFHMVPNTPKRILGLYV